MSVLFSCVTSLRRLTSVCCSIVKAVLCTGGEGPSPALFAARCGAGDLTIAADSGLDLAVRLGLMPDLIVGDFDSVSDPGLPSRYPSAEVISFPRDKDETDTEIAIRIARERGATEVVLVGGGGGRLDHLLGIVEQFERNSRPDLWISAGCVVRAIDSEIRETGAIGDIISFIPLGCEPCTMRSTGLRWPLDRIEWRRGDIGVSNEFAEPDVCVTMRTGLLLMIRPSGEV